MNNSPTLVLYITFYKVNTYVMAETVVPLADKLAWMLTHMVSSLRINNVTYSL